MVCSATVQPGHATPVSQISRDGKSRLLELPRSQRHWTGGRNLGRRSGGEGERCHERQRREQFGELTDGVVACLDEMLEMLLFSVSFIPVAMSVVLQYDTVSCYHRALVKLVFAQVFLFTGACCPGLSQSGNMLVI